VVCTKLELVAIFVVDVEQVSLEEVRSVDDHAPYTCGALVAEDFVVLNMEFDRGVGDGGTV